MNSYEAKIAARKARLEARAARLKRVASATYDKAHAMASIIPFGQPILVGHHSEGKDRRYRAKIGRTFDKAFETMDAAKEAAGRAASVGTGGISSDDPEAIAKLKAELADEQNIHAARVADNKAARAAGKSGPWPGWELSNRSANMRRIKGRIEQLEKAATREHQEVLHNSGVKLVQNVEANRMQLLFPGKPSEETRKLLKSRGFRWSPMEGAWQRHLNNAGIWAAKCILEELSK